MDLRAAVEKYLAVAGDFGRLMPLSGFGLDPETTAAMIAAWEEDYQLHRHLELIPVGPGTAGPSAQPGYLVGGIVYTGVIFRPSIRGIIE